MQLKSLPAALIAAGAVTTVSAIGIGSGWTGHEQESAARTSVSVAEVNSAMPWVSAPNYREIVKHAAPAVVGISVAGMHTPTLEE